MGVAESKLSQARNRCNKILEEADSVSPCSLSKKCTADVYSGGTEVDLARKLGNDHDEESSACDGIAENFKINIGPLGNYPDNEIKDNDVKVPVLEGDLKFRGNDGIKKEKVEEPKEKDQHVLHPHEPCSPTKIEVSGNGINLFVEVFGPLDGISEGKNKDVSVKNEGVDIVDGQEFTYDVGDLVWVKTRTPLWWPAMISDPNNAANDATKPEKKGTFLVKYFGNANFIWCENSDLKPFVEYFEKFSLQNSSRSFFGSVEKALSVLGHHVKSKMTCPCFKNDKFDENREESSIPMDKKGRSDVLSSSQFDPLTFSACIRNLARDAYTPNKIELTIIKNSLSAFYSSVGHRQLPLQLLNDKDGVSSDTDKARNNISEARKKSAKARDGEVTISKRKKRRNIRYDADHILGDKTPSSSKGWESRERKKSKYLSYPYVDVNEKVIKEPNGGQETAEDTNSRKQGPKKPSCKMTDNINAPSDELLAELCCTAHDCIYLGKSKYSDSLMRFYTSFRIFAFLDADIASKCLLQQDCTEVEGMTIVKESGNKPMEESVEKTVADKSPKKRAKKKKEKTISAGVDSISNSFNMGPTEPVKESLENDIADKFPKTDNPQEKEKEKEKAVHKKATKKKEQVLSAGMESMCNSFNTDMNNYPKNNAWMISFQQNCSNVPQTKTTPENIDSVPTLPDLNGNQASFSVDRIPSTNQSKPLPKPRNGEFFPPNVDQTVQNIPQLNNGINSTNNNQSWNQEFATRQLDTNVMKNGFSPFVQQSFQMGPFPYTGKPERRKRRRMEKASQVPSGIPDLNGNLLDKTLPEGNPILSPEENPQKKKRSNKYTTADGETNLGGSLLLNFTVGSTLPTKETLVATFSRFGLLKESEMQVLSDSSMQIVYERSSEARFAYRSLEKNNPFGESLVSFKLHCMPDAASRVVERKNKVQMVQAVARADASKNLPAKQGGKARDSLQMVQPLVCGDASNNAPAKHGEVRDIGFIRQNVEIMKLTLEKAGDNLSQEMRAKLENEIKGFLDKITSMDGGSSSSA